MSFSKNSVPGQRSELWGRPAWRPARAETSLLESLPQSQTIAFPDAAKWGSGCAARSAPPAFARTLTRRELSVMRLHDTFRRLFWLLKGYIMPLVFVSPSELQVRIAEKYRLVRLAQNLSRTTLGMRSGVSPETIKRFESKAEISLTSLVRLTFSLGLESEAADEFSKAPTRAPHPCLLRGRESNGQPPSSWDSRTVRRTHWIPAVRPIAGDFSSPIALPLARADLDASFHRRRTCASFFRSPRRFW